MNGSFVSKERAATTANTGRGREGEREGERESRQLRKKTFFFCARVHVCVKGGKSDPQVSCTVDQRPKVLWLGNHHHTGQQAPAVQQRQDSKMTKRGRARKRDNAALTDGVKGHKMVKVVSGLAKQLSQRGKVRGDSQTVNARALCSCQAKNERRNGKKTGDTKEKERESYPKRWQQKFRPLSSARCLFFA
jgi:hypothetical protein